MLSSAICSFGFSAILSLTYLQSLFSGAARISRLLVEKSRYYLPLLLPQRSPFLPIKSASLRLKSICRLYAVPLRLDKLNFCHAQPEIAAPLAMELPLAQSLRASPPLPSIRLSILQDALVDLLLDFRVGCDVRKPDNQGSLLRSPVEVLDKLIAAEDNVVL